MNKKWLYGLIGTIIAVVFTFLIYSTKDIIVYAGERDRELTRVIEEVKMLKKGDDAKSEKIDKMNDKIISIYTIVKALAVKEGLSYD